MWKEKKTGIKNTSFLFSFLGPLIRGQWQGEIYFYIFLKVEQHSTASAPEHL